MAEAADVVIVGSGFGGAVCALRLAEAGLDVLVLERGQPYPPGSFPRTPQGMRTNFWQPDGGLYGLFEPWSFSDLTMVVSAGLGGGSLIYANVMLRKPEETFTTADPGDGTVVPWPVTRADLEPHYDRVEAVQRPQRFPIGVAPYASTPRTLAMLAAANEMRLPCELPPLGVLFAPSAEEEPRPRLPVPGPNLHGAARSTCRLCGECDIGCNDGAKQTLDLTYLSAAVRAGARVRCCCEVTAVTRLSGRRGFEIRYRQHVAARLEHPSALLDPSPSRSEGIVRARRCVLAAGAVGTTRLLLANRAGLPGLSPALGTRVSGNGDGLALVRDSHRADGKPWYLEPSRGPVITASIHVPADRASSGRAHELQDAGAPAFSEWLWQLPEVPGDAWRARRSLWRRFIAALRGRRVTQEGDLAAQLLGDAHASAAMMPLLGMGLDTPNGRYRLGAGGELELDWSSEADGDYYDDQRRGFAAVARALGGRLHAGHGGSVLAPLGPRGITAHPLGGCPMAVDSRRGVADGWGRVYGHDGLYVADGSLLPGPVGPNPSFTIAALADRIADGLIEDARA